MTTTAGRWAAVTASVRGASHERNGKPNQDAVRVVQAKGSTPGLVAAVCDGHGGDRYVRSDVGSRLGVEVACDIARRALEQLVTLPDKSVLQAQLTGPLTEAIVQRWRERVLEDVRARPFTDEERTRARAPLDGDPLISYGCTLLLAILTPAWVGLLQIGDGDVTVVRGSSVESPVPDDDRLVGGETTSLCLPTAVSDVRVHVIAEPLPDTLILTTDGYANSFADPNWRTHAGIDLRDQIHRTGLDAVEARLPAWLADSASAGGDDVSMALIQRVDSPPPPAVAVGRQPAAALAPANGAAAPARGIGRGVLVGALAAAILIGGGVGWLVGRSNDTTTDAAGTIVAAASTTVAAPSTTSTQPPITEPKVVEQITTPDTAAPPTTTPLPVPLAGERTIVLTGSDAGVLLMFDPSGPSPGSARLFARFAAPGVSPALPAKWAFAEGHLTLDDPAFEKAPAIAVAQTDGYVWALSPDFKTLTSYDVKNGRAGQPVPITDVVTEPDESQDTTPSATPPSDGTTATTSPTKTEE